MINKSFMRALLGLAHALSHIGEETISFGR